ncbi:MAG TPA: GNAT family N-acetyltransferase [Deinococcales bacterium]|nr:GNAT family N-acetyltransferase [Deinococcales bacterium]
MTALALDLRKINLRTASQTEYEALTDFWNTMRFEREPDEPPIPVEERSASWRGLPPVLVNHTWTIWSENGASIVALGEIGFMDVPENRHLVDAGIFVRPGHRGRGYARELLARLAQTAEAEGRTLLLGSTNDRVPAGGEFLRRLGGDPGLAGHANVLHVKDLDRALLEGWIARAGERAAAYEVGYNDGPYPRERLEAIARLHTVMNTAPRGDLDIEDQDTTPEQVLQWEQQMLATGEHRYTAWATVRETGEFAGFSELYWNPNRPHMLGQGATGVFPAHRDRGLGRWLKAANLLRVLDLHPEVTKVRTGNADSNKAMLGINYAMGFKPHIAFTHWQVPLEKVKEYLARRR